MKLDTENQDLVQNLDRVSLIPVQQYVNLRLMS